MAFAGDAPPPRKIPWLTLGQLQFKLLTSPTSLRTGWSYNYVPQERIEGKPTLQQVGGQLRSVELEFQLHSEFCDPEQQLQELIDMADMGEAVVMILGDRWEGYWVIEEIPVVWRKTDEEARLISIEVRVFLKEFVGVVLERKTTQTGFPQRDRSA